MRISPPIRIALLVGIPLLAAFLAYLFMARFFLTAVDPNDKSEVYVEIPANSSFHEMARIIEKQGVVRHARSLIVLAKVRRIKDTNIEPGEYIFSKSMTPKDILGALVSGKILKRKVTVIEGMSIWEIGPLVAEAGLITQAEFEQAVVDPRLLVKAGISASSFEGYLYPDTYLFSKPITAQLIIWQMLEEGEKHWSTEFSDQAEKIKLSRHEILTLASIIEKETGAIEEMPTISSVFHNRLNQGMKLQSDPTVIYGIPNFNGNITKDDLQRPSPYNTYVNYGLTPGPIANPSDNAIRAALFPKETTYLFFVGNGHGSHEFATTLNEHNDNVRKYQLQPRAQKEQAKEAPEAAAPTIAAGSEDSKPAGSVREKSAKAPAAIPES